MSNSNAVSALQSRYKDGYRVARVVIRIGTGVKVLGILLGGLIILSSLMGAFALADSQRISGRDGAKGALLVGFVIGVGIALVSFAIGVLISSAGQMHVAVLDSAVSVAPLLDERQRLDIILGSTKPTGKIKTSKQYIGGWTCGCGYVNSDRTKCLQCERDRPAYR